MTKNIFGLLTMLLFCLHVQVFGFEVPANDQYVTDNANVLSDQEETSLEAVLFDIWQKTDIEGAILTIPSLDGESIESVSLQVAETWGIGDAEKDNGFLILTAIEDRKVRIEVGYGLEYLLTDGRTKRIIDNNIPPYFRAGDYAGGFQSALTEIHKILSGDYEISEFEGNAIDTEEYYYDDSLDGAYAIIFIASFLFFIVGLVLFTKFVVTDPKGNALQKAKAKADGKTKPYVDAVGWRSFWIIVFIGCIVLFALTSLLFASILTTLLSLFIALGIAVADGSGSGSGGSSSRSSSSRSSGSSRSSPSSSSSSSWSSGSSFGGFSGGSFGGGGSSGSW